MSEIEPETSHNLAVDETNNVVQLFSPKKLIAELALNGVKDEYQLKEGFDKRDDVLPKNVIIGALEHLADCDGDYNGSIKWPPLGPLNKPILVDALQSFRFSVSENVQNLIDKDRVINLVEQQLVNISQLPSRDTSVMNWRTLLVVCHRLRTDELDQFGEDLLEPLTEDKSQMLSDKLWNAIMLRLDNSRPAILRSEPVSGV